VETAKIVGLTLAVAMFALLGCEGEWTDAPVGRTSCTLYDFLPGSHRALKMTSGNNGNNLYILDNFSYVHSYKRDGLYECAFDLENSYGFNGFPEDVFFAGNGFYVKDKASLKSQNDTEECYAKDGFFAVAGNELAVGSNAGIETWSIKPCTKRGNVSSWGVFALAATNSDYYAVEGAGAMQNLAMYSKSGTLGNTEPLSVMPGNEKNFCSASRLAANNYGVYLFDRECRKIGVFDNSAVWRKTINIDSLGIRNPLDIAAGEYSYVFILHEGGVEKINVF
jgi:hypothetical protein